MECKELQLMRLGNFRIPLDKLMIIAKMKKKIKLKISFQMTMLYVNEFQRQQPMPAAREEENTKS